MHTALNKIQSNALIYIDFPLNFGGFVSHINELRYSGQRMATMELKRINDSAQRNEPKPGQYKIQNFDTRISNETAEALKQVDVNMRLAEQKAGRLLVA